jgi:hypothetical protein
MLPYRKIMTKARKNNKIETRFGTVIVDMLILVLLQEIIDGLIYRIA